MPRSSLIGWCLVLGAMMHLAPVRAADDPTATNGQTKEKSKEDAKAKDAIKEVAGTAEFLRNVPKKMALLEDFDVQKNTVRLTIDGEKEAKDWRLTPDAEIKVHGWWGRLDDLERRRKVWAWFHVDRKKKPVSIFMVADESSEQDIHGDGFEVVSIKEEGLKVKDREGNNRDYPTPVSYWKGDKKAGVKDIKTGDKIFLTSLRTADREPQYDAYDTAAMSALREVQKKKLRTLWIQQGLPATLGFVHVYSGEADALVDHEGMRWARLLKAGDKVQLAAEPPIKAVVKTVTAQREKTQVRLVIHSLDLAELAIGQRVRLLMKPPGVDVENSQYPPEIDVVRTKGERIDWFLANIYCTCGVGGDRCTGHFYTLASCNPNACGLPNATRKELSGLIDKGLTDRQIFDHLLQERGPEMLRAHLRP